MYTSVLIASTCLFSGGMWQPLLNVALGEGMGFWAAFVFVGAADGVVFLVALQVGVLCDDVVVRL